MTVTAYSASGNKTNVRPNRYPDAGKFALYGADGNPISIVPDANIPPGLPPSVVVYDANMRSMAVSRNDVLMAIVNGPFPFSKALEPVRLKAPKVAQSSVVVADYRSNDVAGIVRSLRSIVNAIASSALPRRQADEALRSFEELDDDEVPCVMVVREYVTSVRDGTLPAAPVPSRVLTAIESDAHHQRHDDTGSVKVSSPYLGGDR